MRHLSVWKWLYIPCFEVVLSPKGLTQLQNKVYTYAFHGLACVTIQCVLYYTMNALLLATKKVTITITITIGQNITIAHPWLACATTQCVRYYTMRALLLATKKFHHYIRLLA